MAPANVTPKLTPATGVTTIHIHEHRLYSPDRCRDPGYRHHLDNNDNITHTIKMIGNNTGMFNSGAIVPHGGFSYTFGNTGTFVYAFADNTTITGTIIVQAPNTVLRGSLY